jgi:alginate production protein
VLATLALALAGGPAPARAARDGPEADLFDTPGPARQREAAEEAEEAEEEGGRESAEQEAAEGLRLRLTEREDKRRPARPWSTDVAGRPLTVGGEWELEVGYLRRRLLADRPERADRLLVEQGLQLETFYSFGPPLSLFAQVRLTMEQDALSHTFEGVSDYYVERDEMWLVSEDVLGSGVSVELGRLDFEDDRRWWWDDDLDAARVSWETESTEVSVALARELISDRSDRSWVDPNDDGVLRVLGELSWDFRRGQAAEWFVLAQDDHSRREQLGEVRGKEREDESDATLLWLGARLMGVFDLGPHGLFGYWLDAAWLQGHERFAEYEEVSRRRSRVDRVGERDVRGWAFDLGLGWILPLPWEPRIFGGYALASGDPAPESGTDRAFRQTGLQANEAGFGGVERFPSYGLVLDPELSNLGIVTLGVGLSLLRASSLDLVYHYYRLAQPADSLRDARLEAELDGVHRGVGHALDLVLALEEWERFEFDLALGALRLGPAFGANQGRWSAGGFVAVRYAF